VPIKALETVFQGVRLHISVAALVTSTLATLSASHLLAEAAAKLALTAVATSAAEGALVGSNRRVYPISILALPLLTLLYYSVALPRLVPLDLVLLPAMSPALGLCLAPGSYLPRRPLIPLLSLFSACYAITSAKVLDPGFEPVLRVLWHAALSLVLVAIGLAGSRALRRHVDRVVICLESLLSYLRVSTARLPRPHRTAGLLAEILWEPHPQLGVGRGGSGSWSLVVELEHLPGLEGFLASVTRVTDKLASVPIEVVYTALVKLMSLVASFEEALARSVRRASLVVEIAQNYIERSLTYSLLLIGLLTTIALIAYAVITTLR